MGLLDETVSVPRRTMTLFFLIDTSGSMEGNKIGAVNDAVVNVLPMLNDISETNPDAEIKVAALEFSNGVNWLYDEPKLAKDFIWQDVTASGLTSLGAACSELASKLSRSGGFMQSASGSFAPAIILLSDGGPTDDYNTGLAKLKANNWFKSAIKIAIAIGDDADKDVLKDFTGSSEAVITVHNIDARLKSLQVLRRHLAAYHSAREGVYVNTLIGRYDVFDAQHITGCEMTGHNSLRSGTGNFNVATGGKETVGAFVYLGKSGFCVVFGQNAIQTFTGKVGLSTAHGHRLAIATGNEGNRGL